MSSLRLPLVSLSLACLVVLACRSKAPRVAPDLLDRLEAPREHVLVPAPVDIEHYALDLALDPAQRSLTGTCRVRFVALEELGQLVLDLEGLAVERVTDAEGRALSFDHAGGRLTIELAGPLAAGAGSEVTIDYGGRPAKGLWFVAERDGVPTQVFTQGECEDARWWFPCRDVPSERATSELRVTMPVGWRAIAAGRRLERREAGGEASELWRMATPHPSYLVTLVAGELVEETASWDGIPLVSLSAPEHASAMEAAFERTGDILAFFSELTGVRYPYPKYGQACVANFPFGGMENMSATTLTETTLKDERGRRDGASEGLVAHEAAHQWFGDLLTCREWSHIWLNEGFATYLTALWFEHSEGQEAFRRRMRGIQESYLRQDTGARRRPTVWNVYRDPMDLFSSGHAYPGGASRLHYLRFIVGDRAFFRGLRLYVGHNAGRSVVTADLQRAMEEAAQQDLDWFFDQWLRSPGYPELEVRWRFDPNRKRVHLAVDQVQEIEDGTPTAFRLPVDVEVRTSDGLKQHRIVIDRRRHLFDLPCDEEPMWVRFDKGGWMPKRLRSRKEHDEWHLILAEDKDVNGRLDAVRALASMEDEESTDDAERAAIREALVACLAGDADQRIREAAASSLGEMRARVIRRATLASEEGRVREDDVPAAARMRAALEDAARSDVEARVRVAALNALARAVDGKLVAFAEEVYADGYSWRTMTTAARLRTKAHASEPDEARRWLDERSSSPSPHAVLAAGMVGAYVELGQIEDLAHLRSIVRDPRQPSAVRAQAAGGMATLVSETLELEPGARAELRVEVARELAELLKERTFRLRSAAIGALGDLDDPSVVPLLLAYYERTVFPRERRRIESAVEGLARP